MQYMKALLLAQSKEIRDDGSILEVAIWRLSEPVEPCEHLFKYRLCFGWPGKEAVRYDNERGKGGRNLHMGLEVIKNKLITDEKSVFISFASDGMDNTDMAGAVVDMETIKKAELLGLNPVEYFDNFDSYDFFKQTGDLIDTGPTGANVSDLMILLNKDVKETL
jgi:glycerate-2-kinase